MTQGRVTFRGGRIFDGTRLIDGHAVSFKDGQRVAYGPDADVPALGDVVDLGGDILGPGYVDLQVNGGDGIMLGDDPSVETLRRIARAHRSLGVTHLLPTLITDTPEITRATIAATIDAIREGLPGIAGLHLEGPHLSVARKGAHDAALIRPMTENDLAELLAAAAALPCLKVTIAPENVTEAQVTAMAQAGILVSLGHTDADFDTCLGYMAAGARCVTHLFNAMSQLGNREPGLVGAALSCGNVSTGLIADAVHVHPKSIRAAWAAKTAPGRIFLVSDAMAVAGSDKTQFTLKDRTILRRNGQLTLADGTLAGADLDLTTAIRVMVEQVGLPLEAVLGAATTTPMQLLQRPVLTPVDANCHLSDLIRIAKDLDHVQYLG
ncbi:N-acetylglucosamine 6-phosphate deacetylase [Aliiroseovarius halocynthiae]|uniref:N-acetylglucosamine-6-phosphate deacetylase n=1 Tax=Aliiroseovarius halocynthiae TaxID=985055 RepID=A0A545SQB8_9RHOB|nr:N-acetylglucosamine-6-phosphate deacetylase [Aliiroseovarius halocynthiae]TQV67172.1 N-acetylglucosamine-6-phosphate deacetylase [Aliiroseovarius halocynthiae]SMR82097.1 N-acetylglucosamine 6-phosphate deacetylase [Aliiroseovarius halocynthiae]